MHMTKDFQLIRSLEELLICGRNLKDSDQFYFLYSQSIATNSMVSMSAYSSATWVEDYGSPPPHNYFCRGREGKPMAWYVKLVVWRAAWKNSYFNNNFLGLSIFIVFLSVLLHETQCRTITYFMKARRKNDNGL